MSTQPEKEDLAGIVNKFNFCKMHKYHHDLHIDKHLHLTKFLSNKYNELLVADVFRLLSLSMISIFLPIYLLGINFSISAVVWMELSMFVLIIFAHYYVMKKIGDWGIKRTLVVSYLLNVVFYVALYYSDVLISDFGKLFFVLVIIALNVSTTSLYWSAHHLYFISSTKVKNQGGKLGLLVGLPTFVGIIGPFMGSVLITEFGFKEAFVVSGFFMSIASIVLFFSDDIKVKIKLDIKKIFDVKNRAKNTVYVMQGISYAATGFIWPVLLFYLGIKLISMGLLYLFSNTAYAAVSYLGGISADKNGNMKIGRIGAIGHGLSLILRTLSSTIALLTTFQTMGGVFGGLMQVALNTGFYKYSHKDVGNSIMNREMYMHFGRIFTVLAFLLALPFATIEGALIFVLILAGISVFSLIIFIKKGNLIVDQKRHFWELSK